MVPKSKAKGADVDPRQEPPGCAAFSTNALNEAEDPRDGIPARRVQVSNIREILDQAMEIDGAVGVALADYESGMCLGTAGGREGFDLEVAAAGNSEVIRSKHKVMSALGLTDEIQDILISLGREYHLMFPRQGTSLFLYMSFDRKTANLALARHKLASLAAQLNV